MQEIQEIVPALADPANISWCYCQLTYTLHQKWSFPLRISSVNVTKYAGNCGFGQI